MPSMKIIIAASIVSAAAGMAIIVGGTAMFWPTDGLGMNYLCLGLLGSYILASLLLTAGRRPPPVGVRRQRGDVRRREPVGPDPQGRRYGCGEAPLAPADAPPVPTPYDRLDYQGSVTLRLNDGSHEPSAAPAPPFDGRHRRRSGRHTGQLVRADRDRPPVPAAGFRHCRRVP